MTFEEVAYALGRSTEKNSFGRTFKGYVERGILHVHGHHVSSRTCDHCGHKVVSYKTMYRLNPEYQRDIMEPA